MDKVLLDSDVIIEWLRGHEPFVTQVASLLEGQSELFWTPVSVAEIYAGVRRGEEPQISKLFVLMESIKLSDSHGKTAGEYLKTYSKSHGVELGDALIAACSKNEGLSLWTLNRKHYPMKDIKFFSPQGA
jgi:predicted nucleic acid-binding protein